MRRRAHALPGAVRAGDVAGGARRRAARRRRAGRARAARARRAARPARSHAREYRFITPLAGLISISAICTTEGTSPTAEPRRGEVGRSRAQFVLKTKRFRLLQNVS